MNGWKEGRWRRQNYRRREGKGIAHENNGLMMDDPGCVFWPACGLSLEVILEV